jgi:hypothetical protein
MRITYDRNKKKIRGWKRRIRQVDRWGEWIKQPYLDYFISEGGRYTYERCTLYPFYTLDKRHPPLWFYKHIINKLVTAYSIWEHVFKELSVPHDLQLWLYDPAYIRSEIICYKMAEEGQHKRFVWESELEKPFPYEKFSSFGIDLTKFEWILADDANIHFEDDFDYAGFTLEDLLADGYAKKEQGEGEIYYSKRVGDIWIGRRKGSINSDSKNITQSYYAPPKMLSPEIVDAFTKTS